MLVVSWNYTELAATVKLDHGYRADSEAITLLFEVISEFTPEEQRLFVSFVTGSPNLPVGGTLCYGCVLRILVSFRSW